MRVADAAKVCARPFLDVLRGLEACVAADPRQLVVALAAFLLGWWLYVPIHELLHALGCAITGGQVSRLEISGIYGGGLLARLFPFVVSGGEYAGRLSGFDTGGSDLVYLATDQGPYLLTIFPGVWLLRKGGASGRGLLFGLALPLALAPFLSLTGDAYEIGSIVATRLPPWSAPPVQELLRGDDVFRVVSKLRAGAVHRPWTGLVVSAALGVVWAFATYLAGAGVARLLGQRAVEPAPRGGARP